MEWAYYKRYPANTVLVVELLNPGRPLYLYNIIVQWTLLIFTHVYFINTFFLF